MRLKERKLLPINLRFFGENGDNGIQESDSGGEDNSDNGKNSADENGENSTDDKPEDETSRLDKLIEEAVKRQTKKMSDENKKLSKALEKLQKEKLSEEELKQLELDNKIAEIAEREKQIIEQENRLHAIKAIKEIGLDDGSENSLELIDFVMSGTKEEIDGKVKTFSALVNKFVKAEVDRRFKENGRIPGKNNSGGGISDGGIAALLGKIASQDNEKSRNIIDSYLNK